MAATPAPSFVTRRPRAWLAALTLGSLAPFLGKAFHVDEPLFIWVAQHIRQSPIDPYGFTVNWYGTVVPMSEAMRNPPLSMYVMAMWGSIAGWSEVSLHALFLLPAVAAALGIYALAACWCRRPLLASVVAISSPAFLVSSTSVMCDVMMLACWVWAMAFWIRGVDARDNRQLLAGAAMAAACVLTKYNGAGVLPLLALYATWRRRPYAVVYLALPAVVLAGYGAFMVRQYGAASLAAAVSLATDDRAVASAASGLSRIVITLSFTGGCFVAALCSALLLWPRVAAVCAAVVVAAGLWAPPFAGLFTGSDLHDVQLGLFVAGGAALVALGVADARRLWDAASGVLVCWLAGTLIFSSVVSWSTSARYLLPLTPVSGILIARALDARGVNGRRAWLPAIASFVLALLVARADAVQAGSARTAARTIQQGHAGQPGTLWYQGHWGFQYYLDLGGAKAVDFDHPWFAAGDVMIIPANNANTSVIDPKWVAKSDGLQFAVVPWLSTLSSDLGAGFYSSVFGALPFAVGDVAPERYTSVTIKGR